MTGILTSILKPFTTAKAGGVVLRDVVIAVGSIIALLGILGVLTPQQVADLTKAVEDLSGQWPAIVAAFGTLMAVGMSIYRTLTKSSSDKAAEVAKEVDAKVPVASPVVIKTPEGKPDIIVPADRK